jgi:hypothetical protein
MLKTRAGRALASRHLKMTRLSGETSKHASGVTAARSLVRAVGRAPYGALSLAMLVAALFGCGAMSLPEATAPLPPPPNDTPLLAVPASSLAFEQLGDEAAALRTRLTIAGPGGTTIEIHDLIVGPGGQASLPPVQAARVLDTRSGLGSLVAAGQAQEISSQRPVSLPAGVQAMLRNGGETSLVLRVYSIRSR